MKANRRLLLSASSGADRTASLWSSLSWLDKAGRDTRTCLFLCSAWVREGETCVTDQTLNVSLVYSLGGLRAEDGEGVQWLRPLESHLPLQQPRQERRAEVRGLSPAAVRVQRGLLPDPAGLSPTLLRVLWAPYGRHFPPHHPRGERLRRFPHRSRSPAQAPHLHEEPGRDPRRRSAEVLPPAGAWLPRSVGHRDEAAAALHVLALLHRLSRREWAEEEAGVVPAEPLRGPGGQEVWLSGHAVRGGAGEHRVPDGPREAADSQPHLLAGAAGPGWAERHPERRQRHLFLPAGSLCLGWQLQQLLCGAGSAGLSLSSLTSSALSSSYATSHVRHLVAL